MIRSCSEILKQAQAFLIAAIDYVTTDLLLELIMTIDTMILHLPFYFN